MALLYTNHKCFKDVEAQYNATPVIRSKFGKANDIRPIGDRRRKHERICKINENCYAIMEGYGYGDPVFKSWQAGQELVITPAVTEQYAPIVWRKHRDGSETIKLSNGSGPLGHHNAIYDALNRHLPSGLRFVNKNGKHFIRIGGAQWGQQHGEDYYLAKRLTVPKQVKKHWEAYYNKMPQSQQVWVTERQGWMQSRDDRAALVFRRVDGGGWVHDSGGVPLPSAPKVNKELKAKYKSRMDEFYDWGITMTPLLPLETGTYTHSLEKNLTAYKMEYYGASKKRAFWLRDVLKDPDHPMRVAAWVDFASSFNARNRGWDGRESIKRYMQEGNMAAIRSVFNTWVNKTAKFIKK